MNGLVHIYTGDGKGKTTAAIGLGIRACGSGMKVLMVQFLKGRQSSEEIIIDKLKPDFELVKHKQFNKFSWEMTAEEKKELQECMLQLFEYVLESAGNKDIIIMDEIMAAVTSGFIALESVTDFVKNKPPELELVLTGRNPPAELIGLADYVSEINAVKHPFGKGVAARKGIEF